MKTATALPFTRVLAAIRADFRREWHWVCCCVGCRAAARREQGGRSLVRHSIETIASGRLSICIADEVSWADFPEQAQAFLKRVRGRALIRVETPMERYWLVLIRWRLFLLDFDDCLLCMSLAALTRSGDVIVQDMHRTLAGAT